MQLDDTTYELLLLHCVVEAASHIVGVIALCAADRTRSGMAQNQLLSTIAAYLVQAGDSRAVSA